MMTLFDHEEAFNAFLYQAEKKAMDKGFAQGQDKMAVLINKLMAAGRLDDLAAAANDRDIRLQLMKEFGLVVS